MTDMPPTPAERAEAAATRRRWISLAEIVAVAGVLIAALTLWSNWSDRRADERERQAERTAEVKQRTLVAINGTPAKGGSVLLLADPAHAIQSVDVRLPSAFGLPPKNSAVEPRIETDWFAKTLLEMTDGGPDTQQGRLPVIIGSGYWDGDKFRTSAGLYDIVWRTEGRLLRGRTVKLLGLVLRARGGSVHALDAAWAAEKPNPRK